MCMIDAHAHVHDAAFDADREGVLERAWSNGVRTIITIGTDLEESQRAVACAETQEHIWASVGLHPHFFDEEYGIWDVEYREKTLVHKESHIQHVTFDILSKGKERIQEYTEQLRKVAESSSKVVAIGECGLDYYRRQLTANSQQETITDEQKAFQREGFLAQIGIAESLGLPLIIHTRPSEGSMDAYEDLFDLLKANSYKLTTILHCYMGDVAATEKFLSLPNLWFSFTGNITYKAKEGSGRDETLRMIPIDRMLVETDCPYLAPVPYRGQRNEPAYVAEVVRKIAEMQQMAYTEVNELIDASVRRIFPRIFENR